MTIDPEYARHYYASLRDEALRAINRAELVEIAQKYYDEELARRDEDATVEGATRHNRHKPVWLAKAAQVFSFFASLQTAPPPAADAQGETLPDRSVTFWRIDIRKAALIACIAAILTILSRAWNLTPAILFRIEPTYLQKWIMAVFYFALYRNRQALRFPKRFRVLALAATVVLSTTAAAAVVNWTGFFESRSVMSDEPWIIVGVPALLGAVTNLPAILLLITFFNEANDESHTSISVSPLLHIVTVATVLTGGPC